MDKISSQLISDHVSKECLVLGLVANPVIEAIARPEFEDGLRTGVLPGDCWGP